MPPERDDLPLTPRQVAARTGGKVLFELLWVPMEPGVARKGTKKIIDLVKWLYEEHDRKMPAEVEEMLRWLRDHFGSDQDRKRARDQRQRTK